MQMLLQLETFSKVHQGHVILLLVWTFLVCPLNISQHYATFVGIQLDAHAYEQKERIALQTLEMYFDECYISRNSEFSYNVFKNTYIAMNYTYEIVADAVQHLIDGWMAKDDQSLTQLELAILDTNKANFIALCEENDDESDEHSDDDDEESFLAAWVRGKAMHYCFALSAGVCWKSTFYKG